VADDILRQGVQGISDIITIPGIINRDFADVKAIMAGMGYAVMGTATAKGERRTMEAAQRAIASPLLEAGAIDGARGILINITGSSSLKLAEVNEASTIIQSAAHEDANIIFGAVLDEKMKDEVKITVIATGFRSDNVARLRESVRTQPYDHSRFAPAQPAINPRQDRPYQVREERELEVADEPVSEAAEPVPTQVHEKAAAAIPEPPRAPALPREPEPPVWSAQPGRRIVDVPAPPNAPQAEFEQDELDVPAYLRKRGDNQ
jgi:cell division protein FtsZ